MGTVKVKTAAKQTAAMACTVRKMTRPGQRENATTTRAVKRTNQLSIRPHRWSLNLSNLLIRTHLKQSIRNSPLEILFTLIFLICVQMIFKK